MDMRYLRYVSPNEIFYVSPKRKIKESLLNISFDLNGWSSQIDSMGHWKYYFKKNTQLPLQGWKIHISANLKSAQKTLDIVVPILAENEVPFKYVYNLYELAMKNSKYGDRGSSGKFITIYPKNTNQFIYLLNKLHDNLKEILRGPYILSDKRWENGNVYFRYGAFAEMYIHDGAQKQLAIKKPDGTYIPDLRGPCYVVPDFIDEPKEIKQMDANRDDNDCDCSILNNYEMKSALHYSNGGGVYQATDVTSGKTVVIKEGRPNAGLDGRNWDAVKRIEKEYEMLDRLKGSKYVVNVHRIFKAWEHTFMVEDFIEGTTLNTWIAAFYPFSNMQDSQKHAEKAIKIITQLIEAIKEIHSKNVGIGDLQPSNIMINKEDDSIKLIDFESASFLSDERPSGLMTPGFVSPLAKSREQSDWFALLRIARFLFLPIGPIMDLDNSLNQKHDIWISETFGNEAMQIIRQIQNECSKRIKEDRKYKFKSKNKFYKKSDIGNVCKQIRNGIVSKIKLKKQLLPGDIRQYEESGGLINVLTGGMGVVMSLKRTGSLPEIAKKWIEKYCKDKYLNEADEGLFTGKTGIANVLYEVGYKDRALEIMQNLDINLDSKDVSLLSGLSGIGLGLLAFYKITKNVNFLSQAKKIGNRLIQLLKENIEIKPYDMDFIPMGLIDGWSSASLFASALYRCTSEEKWIKLATDSLKKDLDKCVFTDEKTLQLKDDARFVPYLSGGSSGIGLALLELKNILNTKKWDKEILAIGNLARSKCFYSSGLFRGCLGILVNANALDNSEFNEDSFVSDAMKILNLYLLDSKNSIFIPGDYSYRISGDIFSGSSGALLALNDIDSGHWLSWIPIANINNFDYLYGCGPKK